MSEAYSSFSTGRRRRFDVDLTSTLDRLPSLSAPELHPEFKLATDKCALWPLPLRCFRDGRPG